MHVMIRDLFSNQKLHINNFNKALYGLTNRRRSYIVALDHEKTHDYTILRQAVARLSFNVYSQLFLNKCIESDNYKKLVLPIETNSSIIQIQRHGTNAPPRVFNDSSVRCNCEFHVCHLLICCHEICLHKQFK